MRTQCSDCKKFYTCKSRDECTGWEYDGYTNEVTYQLDETCNVTVPADVVDHPAHYNRYPVEVYTIIGWVLKAYQDKMPNELLYDLGNVIKYIFRAPFKGKLAEDLSKAAWYLNKVVEGSK